MRAFLFLLLIAAITACTKHTDTASALPITKSNLPNLLITKPTIKWVAAADSGYITTKQALDWKLYTPYGQDVALWWKYNAHEHHTNTIGKFYKTETNSYIICIMEDDGYLLTELLPGKGATDSIIASEHYRHWNYNCCVSDIDEGFKKTQDFFFLKACGTGMGFCGANMLLFKHVQPKDELAFIHLNTRTYCCYLDYTMHLANDKLTMNYKADAKPCEGQEDIIKRQLNYITLNYQWKNNRWVLLDSTGLKKLWDVFPF